MLAATRLSRLPFETRIPQQPSPAQALCTEASLHALRRRYPQIYDSDDKLLIDPASIAVEQPDFVAALSAITPASHRSAAAHARCGAAGSYETHLKAAANAVTASTALSSCCCLAWHGALQQ